MTAKSKPYAIIEIACGGASCSVCNITSSMLHGRRQSTTSNLARRFGQCGQHAAGRARTGAAGHRDAGAGGSVGGDLDHRRQPGAISQPCRRRGVSREVTPAGVVHRTIVGVGAPGGIAGRRLPRSWKPILPFELNQARRHRIPRQAHEVTNWPAYEARLRQRGSLTVWFSDEAIKA